MTEARPGPNAFAQQAARMERHRLESNAFYQAEVQRRKATPPTNLHPALRDRGNEVDRGSSMTTMSPFINAGKIPPLNLVPIDQKFVEPTTRGYIEERREQLHHQTSGSSEERVPVYQTFAPTPKVGGGEEFEKGKEMQKGIMKTPGKGKGRVSLGSKDGEKSPTRKGGFFEKLKLSRLAGGGSTSASPSGSTTVGAEDLLMEEAGVMPVKAQAVLGAPPSKPNGVTRSPSKQGKRSLFTAKKAALNVDTATSQTAPSPASGQRTGGSVSKTPQTAFSDPTHYSYVPVGTTHMASQTLPDRGGAAHSGPPTHHQHAIQRSQSLKYFDSGVPPTPPAKNTPPELKDKDRTANKAAGAAAASKREMAYTPSKSPLGLISLTGCLSPTRTGRYGHRETARLVTRPNIYSLHASVVPEAMQASTFEEMRARVEGLDLEGFSMPSEMRSSPAVGAVYSPSIYGEEWEGEKVGHMVKGKGRAKRMSADAMALGLGLPTVKEEERVAPGKHKRTKGSDESAGTIQMCYPELAKDPSFSPDMKAHLLEGSKAAKSNSGSDMGDMQQHDNQTLMHGCTHSKGHNIDCARLSANTHLFAAPVDSALEHSPASFTHKSAMPSPLQYLPATTCSPPPKASTQRVDQGSPIARSKIQEVQRANSGLGIHGVSSQSRNTTGIATKSIYDKIPDLSVQRCATPTRPPSNNKDRALSTSPDPAKSSPSSTVASSGHDKMDQVLALLSALRSRNGDVQAMREEMRAANARLDARLAHIERGGTGSLSPNSSVMDGLDGSSSSDHVTDGIEIVAEADVGKRVSTCDAHDFYRLGRMAEGVEDDRGEQEGWREDEGEVAGDRDVDRVAELVRENRQLTEMVQGLAAQLEEMRRSMRGR